MSYITWLKGGVIGGLLLVLAVPFLVADGQLLLPNLFFPYITGKNFFFRVVVELTFGLYVILALREPKYRPRASLLSWASLAFVAWGGVVVLTSVDPLKSFWSNFERMDGYITLIHLYVYFIVAGAVLSAERWWYQFFQASLAASVVMGAYGLLQKMGILAISTQSGPRVDGTFGNATYMAVYMLFNIFLALLLLSRDYQVAQKRWWYVLVIVLNASVLYATETRGALLGLIAGLVVAALYLVWSARGPEWKRARQYALYTLAGVACLVAAFFAVKDTALVKSSNTLQRLASISLEDKTTKSRFIIWGMAYQGFLERPIVGWGQENFNYVFNKNYNPVMYDQEQWFDRAHNQFLDWLIAGGLPMFALYLSLFLFALWVILRASALSVLEQSILVGLLAAYGFNNLFVFDNIMSAVLFWTVLAFVHSHAEKRPPLFFVSTRPVSGQTTAVIVPVVVVLTLGVVWALNVPGLVRAQTLITAITTTETTIDAGGNAVASSKNPSKNLAQMGEVIESPVWPGTGLGRQESVEQLFQFSSSLAASQNPDPALLERAYAQVRSIGSAMLQDRAGDARLELFYGSTVNSFGQYKEALEHLNKAREFSPRKQTIYMQLGVTYLSSGEMAKAVEAFRQAYELAPAYPEARILYAAGLYYASQTATADALLKEGFGSVVVDDARLLRIFTVLKYYDRVIAIWKMRVSASPNDIQTHAGLAGAYYMTGDKENAIAELRKTVEIDPSLAPQVEVVITQVRNGTLKLNY